MNVGVLTGVLVTASDLKKLIDRVRASLRVIPSGMTPEQIADETYRDFPDLWPALVPILRVQWIVHQMRALRDQNQLPLFGRFGTAGIILSESKSIEVRREKWTDEQWRTQGQRYYRAVKENVGALQRLATDYEAVRGEQYELFSGKTVDDALRDMVCSPRTVL